MIKRWDNYGDRGGNKDEIGGVWVWFIGNPICLCGSGGGEGLQSNALKIIAQVDKKKP